MRHIIIASALALALAGCAKDSTLRDLRYAQADCSAGNQWQCDQAARLAEQAHHERQQTTALAAAPILAPAIIFYCMSGGC